MKKALKEKLESVVALVNNVLADPDIEIDYCIPEVTTTSESCDVSGLPYIEAKYTEDKYLDRKIRLSDQYLQKTPEDIANLVTFYIEQFKEEVDSLQYGAQ